MALTGPKFLPSTEDAPRGWVIKATSTVYRCAAIAVYTAAAGADQGYADNVGASANMAILGVAEQNGGALPAGHTLTMAQEVRAIEMIIPMVAGGSTGSVSTANRGALVFGVDSNTFSLTAGDGIPMGEFIEFIDSTHAKIGVGPTFVARAAAAAAALLTSANPFQVDEFTPAPAATSTTALLAATATVNGTQTLSSFVAGGVAALLAHARNVTFTGGGTTASCPTSAALTGTDTDGNALTETVALTSGSGTGVKCFKTLASAVLTGGTATNGTTAIGVGSKLGLSKTIRSRSDRLAVVQEVADASGTGSVVTNGVFASATTSPPHGSYTPNAAPDGTYQYTVTYEHS